MRVHPARRCRRRRPDEPVRGYGRRMLLGLRADTEREPQVRFLAARRQNQHLVARLEHCIPARHDDFAFRDDRHDVRALGDREFGERLADGLRIRRERDLVDDHVLGRERHECDDVAETDFLLDQAVDDLGGRDRHVDAPRLGEHPLVLGVVGPGEDHRHLVRRLAQERDDQVVLVVTGQRRDEIGLRRARLVEHARARNRRREPP